MKYNLRVCIHPDSWEKQMEDLIWACKYANIEEVLLCEHPYEIAPIIQPLSYHQKMRDVLLEVVPILEKNGISCSFYIKASVGHGDRFNVDELSFPFQKFTGVSLKESHHTPCVLDEDWQQYIVQVMSEYAKCNFDKIMIDDDFNSVNHDTGPTGCFCSLHAKKVSEAMGIEIDTEKLFYHVTHNDDFSMKVREAWLNQTYKGQLEAISAMEKGIHEINPKTLFGMMNSSSSAHAMQGRNMRELLEAAAGENNPPLSRPGGWAYSATFHDG
ncbi:MAG: hypothetical protein GX783_07915, partial [Clostridiales bacterium]|nr:hypothetical protein [Clostridiales bacterium]